MKQVSIIKLITKQFKILIFFFLVLGHTAVIAQNCTSTDITLSTQTEIDNFQNNYGNGTICTTVLGNIIIKDDNDGIDNIVNLHGLSQIKTFKKSLSFFNNNQGLNNLDGLSSLVSVEENLIMGFNLLITNIDGLSNLNSVGGNIEIYFNSVINNINGLSNLTSVGGNLIVHNNNSLSNIDGLLGLSSIGNNFELNSNFQLLNIDGLSNLVSIGGDFKLHRNVRLITLDGLSSLRSVGGNLEVDNNPFLSECCGLFSILSGGGSGVSGHIIMSANNVNFGNCNDNGAIAAVNCASSPVPTLGEWGLLLLALSLATFGILYSIQPSIQLANQEKYTLRGKHWRDWRVPFQKNRFCKIWIATLFSVATAFGGAIYFGDYQLTQADIPMSIISSAVFAFMAQLLFVVDTKSNA